MARRYVANAFRFRRYIRHDRTSSGSTWSRMTRADTIFRQKRTISPWTISLGLARSCGYKVWTRFGVMNFVVNSWHCAWTGRKKIAFDLTRPPTDRPIGRTAMPLTPYVVDQIWLCAYPIRLAGTRFEARMTVVRLASRPTHTALAMRHHCDDRRRDLGARTGRPYSRSRKFPPHVRSHRASRVSKGEDMDLSRHREQAPRPEI